MELIELHILQSFPVSCLNRDDLGVPKSAIFGGARRARISSQCLKRSQRELFKELTPDFAQGMRTKLFCDMLRERIEAADYAGNAQELAETLTSIWSKLKENKKVKKGEEREECKVTTLVFLSPAELDAMVQEAIRFFNDNPKAKPSDCLKGVKKAISAVSCKDAADIALFGRMVASDPSLNVEAAAMFTHAISTHKSDTELDFYTALDDKQPEGEMGAGMTGVLEFNSACYYRYIAINLDLLRSNMKGVSEEEIKKILRAFIQSALVAVPHARQNSMNAATVPGFVLGLHRKAGHPLQLVNAFEKPVYSSTGYLEDSTAKLLEEYGKMKTTWGLSVDDEAQIPGMPISDFISRLVDSL